VRWKVPISGIGTSTPILHNDRIYLTSAVATDRKAPVTGVKTAQGEAPTNIHEFQVMAYARATGKLIWRKVVHEGVPHERAHRTGSYASASVVVDDKRIHAFFGSNGLFCLDHDGNELWSQQLGRQRTLFGFGEGATPALANGTLVVQWDHEGQSFVIAFAARTGKERWRRDRNCSTSWSSPLITFVDGKHQVILVATKVTRAYDLASGDEVWQCGGMTSNPIAGAVEANGIIYVGNSYKGKVIQAIRLAGAKGDITDKDNLLWSYSKSATYVPMPVITRGLLYSLRNGKGVLTCLDTKTGVPVYAGQRLRLKDLHASPIVANGRIYFCSRAGKTAVVKAGRDFEILATNKLDDVFDASPVAVGTDLFLRGRQHLYCLSAEK